LKNEGTTMEIGLQLYSVRSELQKDYAGTLEKVASIGYRNLELLTTVTGDGLIFGNDLLPAVHKHLLDRLGLKAIGCHVMIQEGMNWEKVIASCLETGAEALVIPFALFNDRQGILDFCRILNHAGELCRKGAVQLYYHNHFQEFQEIDGCMVMDLLLENLDSDLVKIEFDSYWALRGGQDPLEWIRKLGGRCDLLHQKDLPPGVNPVNLFDLFQQDPKLTMWDALATINAAQFAEIGSGVMNITDIIQAGRICGHARYIIVEQDMTSLDELESVTISFKNLSHLLVGSQA